PFPFKLYNLLEQCLPLYKILKYHVLRVGDELLPRESAQEKQKGFIGLALFTSWFVPMTNSTKDIIATQRILDFQIG
ncbi:hypothetical protein KI387_010445, partial [Taxus chinensis]